MDMKEKTIKSENIFSGKILSLRVDEVITPAGKKTSREVIEHSGGVTILAEDNEGHVFLVKQYRQPTGDVILELPAGKLESGEDPETCARRELREETGYNAEEFEYIFSFYTSPGYSDEILHLFSARNLKYVGINPDEDEFLEIYKLKRKEISEHLNNGKVKDAKTLIGLLFYLWGDKHE